MVLYFSGTGNSRYVAKRIASLINDECVNLFDKIKEKDYGIIESDSPYVVVTPIYGWQIPHILRDWLRKVELSGNKNIYFVVTCGGEMGNAEKYIQKLCIEKQLNFMGCAEIVMPENYIAMFDAPQEEEALAIIDKAEPNIESIANQIAGLQMLESKKVSAIGKIKSGIINAVYYPVFLHSKKFVVDDKCISCQKCEKSCIMKNITIVDGKPRWNDKCTHCMACICGCPVGAIEYGKISKGKPRYICPKN